MPKHPKDDTGENDIDMRDVEGAEVQNSNGNPIGKIAHLDGDLETGEAVMDNGGAMSDGPRLVKIQAEDLVFARNDSGDVYAKTELSEDEINNLPPQEI